MNNNLNNYCTNCGKKLESDEFICSKCGTPIVDDKGLIIVEKDKKEKKKLTKEDVKKIFKIIGIIIVLIFLIIFVDKTYRNLKITNYLKGKIPSSQLKLNYKGRFKCVGKCKASCDGSCFSYEKEFGCYKYTYEAILNEKDTLDFMITYKLGEGIKESDANRTLSFYNKLKNNISYYLQLNDYSINLSTKSYRGELEYNFRANVNLNIKLTDNLNEQFIKKLLSFFQNTKNFEELNLDFKDNFSITISSYSSDIKIYYNKKENGTGISYELSTNNFEELEKWVNKYVQY